MWYELKIDPCQRDEVNTFTAYLEQLGALSITYKDSANYPILEPMPGEMPLWPYVNITALFDNDGQAAYALAQLQTHYPHAEIHLQYIEEQDWVRMSMDAVKPQCFGKRLWIYPSWITPPSNIDGVVISLDPGLAFGTGNHPTTRLCLTWLADYLMPEKNVIDYGCGSGILAIAALKLDASHVTAIDIDPQALQATGDNADVNHIDSNRLTIAKTLAESAADLIIANILLKPLLELRDYFYTHLSHTEGTLVVSGLLIEQVPLIIEAYAGIFRHQGTETLDNWALVSFSCVS